MTAAKKTDTKHSEAIEITRYGAALSGGARAFGLTPVDGVSVLVTPTTADQNDAAAEVAHRVANHSALAQQSAFALAAALNEAASLKEQLRKVEAKLAEARSINEAAITGRRRFFGPVLMKPAVSGNWAGEVWLLDPVKLERGSALRFASVAEVRSLHPELWVVSATADGVLLDAAKLAEVSR